MFRLMSFHLFNELKVVTSKKEVSVDEDEVLEVELPPPMKIQDHSFTPVHQGLPGSSEKVWCTLIFVYHSILKIC